MTIVKPKIIDRLDTLDSAMADIPNQTYITDKAKQVDLNTTISTVASNYSTLDTKINSQASGSPKGIYVAIADITIAFPIGNSNIYLTSGDGKWNYWNGSTWIPGGTYQSTGIADKSIDAVKTTFMSGISKNLFDKTTVINGKYVKYNTGVITTSAIFSYSAHILLLPNTQYFASSEINDKQIAFFNSSNIYIGGVLNANVFTTPLNTSYCILSAETTDLATVQLEIGTSQTNYVSYQTIDVNKYLNDNAITERHLDFIPIIAVSSKNLFDKTKVTNGQYIKHSDGTIANSSLFCYSAKIALLPSTNYILTDVYNDSQIAFFTINDAYISGVLNPIGFNTPSNISYCIVSVEKESDSLDNIQLEIGSVKTDYVSSTVKVNKDNLDISSLLGIQKVENIVIVDSLGTGDFTTIASALTFCGLSNTKYNTYLVKLKKGIYNETNLTMPDYTILEGEDIDECIIRSNGTIPPYDAMSWTAKHGIWCTVNSTIRNLTMISNAVKYCIHSDSAGNYTANYENLKLSNDQPCIGMGLRGNQFVNIKNVECKYTGIGDWAYGTYIHNFSTQTSSCKLMMENIKNINCSILDLNNLNSGQNDNIEVINCTSNLLDGGIWRRDNNYSESMKLNVVGNINFIDVDTSIIPNNNYHAEGFYDTYVFNNTGATILKGYGVAVDYASSDTKTKAVKLANSRVDGIALKDIATGNYGWVCMPKKVSYAFTNGITYSKGTFYKCVSGLFIVTTEDLATAICLENVVNNVIKSYVKVKLI